MTTKCPNCRIELDILNQYIGRKVECPNCKHKFIVSNDRTRAKQAISVACPHCQAKYTIEKRNQGKALKCGKCHKTFIARPPVSIKKTPISGNVDYEEEHLGSQWEWRKLFTVLALLAAFLLVFTLGYPGVPFAGLLLVITLPLIRGE